MSFQTKKLLLHSLSALIGLAIAAMIVFIVFGSASEDGASQEGDSGHSTQNAESNRAAGESAEARWCGTYKEPAARNRQAIDRARSNLPIVRNQKGVAVSPSDPAQISWFATVSAAAGLCMNEISVSQRQHTAKLNFPGSYDKNVTGAFVYSVADELFEAPEGLNRPGIRVEAAYGNGGQSKLVLIISAEAWEHFLRERRRFGLKADINGLYAFNRRIGKLYGRSFQMSGW